MSVGATMDLGLSSIQEERAQRLHQESLVFFAHDHCILEDDILLMQRGGATAKQLHIGVDERLWLEPGAFAATRVPLEPNADVAADPRTSDGFLKSALIALDHVLGLAERSGGRISIALEPDDILRAKEHGAIALLVGAEGARITEYRPEVLRSLARLGLRHLQLSWATKHPLGATQSETSGAGLTTLGMEFVRELNRIGLIVDVSHLSYQSIADAVDGSSAPVLNGHTGALALNPTQPQLLPDDLIRLIASKDGVVAVHFMSQMVKPGRDQATLGQLLDQFEYLTDLVGAEHVACGPDYFSHGETLAANQGITTPFGFADGVQDVSQLSNLTRGLVVRGFTDDQVRLVLGGSLLRLFSDVRRQRSPMIAPPMGPSALPGHLTGGITPL
ncbi:MAG: membrane dipeptidase [Chloroflexi bacterium]|nr:membrane dipeptidase [Chloroflexota bacterium]